MTYLSLDDTGAVICSDQPPLRPGCTPRCSPKHHVFCRGPRCCPHLHVADPQPALSVSQTTTSSRRADHP